MANDLGRKGPAPLDEQGRPLVRVRVQGSPKEGYPAYGLIVPSQIARALPPEFMTGRYFSVEFTDEGILYRPADVQVGSNARPTAPTPDWAK